MDVLIMAGQLILGLMLLIGLHEMGHLVAAKFFGMRVEKFAIGFGPSLLKTTWKGTEYALCAIPLGGYVKISGMLDESLDKEHLDKEPEEWEFRSKPAWQRLIVMLGGIIVNVITGIIIFIFINLVYGESYIPAEKAQYGIVALDIAKEEVGLKTGDKILEINGKKFEKYSDIMGSEIILGSNVNYTIERDGKKMTLKVPSDIVNRIQNEKGNYISPLPRTKSYDVVQVNSGSVAEKIGLEKGDLIVGVGTQKIQFFDELQAALKANATKEVNIIYQRGNKKIEKKTTIPKTGILGFAPNTMSLFEKKNISFGSAVVKGTGDAFGIITTQIKAFGKMFRREMNASESVSSIIGIGKVYGAEWIWSRFWTITGMLSMVLAFMNLLPIPALDGGHVVFLLYEMIAGKPAPQKVMIAAQKVGMVILLALMVFAFGNDIYKHFFK